jgi:hypothetical protein
MVRLRPAVLSSKPAFMEWSTAAADGRPVEEQPAWRDPAVDRLGTRSRRCGTHVMLSSAGRPHGVEDSLPLNVVPGPIRVLDAFYIATPRDVAGRRVTWKIRKSPYGLPRRPRWTLQTSMSSSR